MSLYLSQASRRNIECGGCGGKNPALIRCIDCFGAFSWCQACIIQKHQALPCHRLERWNGDCFVRTSLMDEGYVLHLGHGGSPCPCAGQDGNLQHGVPILKDPSLYRPTVTLAAVNGFFEHKVAWCFCKVDGSRVSAPMQLFHDRWFPATQTRTESAFAFDLLDHFWVDMMECKTSHHSFIQKLGRITNPDFPNKSPVRSSCTLIS